MTTPKNKRCIVTFASRNSNYINGMARLAESLRDRFDGAFIAFTDELSIGSPTHNDMPYAFKVFAIQKAIDAGYTQILWLDCSVWAINQVDKIFDIIDDRGYWFEGAGFWLNDWCTQNVLRHFKLQEKGLIPMIQSGFMGFDLTKGTTINLWNEFKNSCEEGLFYGSWENFRHDQAVISCILSKYDISFNHNPEYVNYPDVLGMNNDSFIFKCQGL